MNNDSLISNNLDLVSVHKSESYNNAVSIVNTEYIRVVNTPSDINEHLVVISEYAEKSESIAELGMRSVVSTWAMIHGLVNNNKPNKRLISVDLNYSPAIENVKQVSQTLGITFHFIMGNDIMIELEPVDLLFIDTWHIYGHLKRELSKHAPNTKKYIILHDTTVDGEVGETLRNGWNPVQQSKDSGYPIEDITKGLWPAVEEFLDNNKEWSLVHRYTHNNGLTILQRLNEY